MKDGRTRLAYKPEHAVDLDTGSDRRRPDPQRRPRRHQDAARHAQSGRNQPRDRRSRRRGQDDPAELVADKGYHSRDGLKELEDSAWKSRIAEPKPNGILRWKGDDDAKRAYYNNRARLLSGVARQAFKLRAELVERGPSHSILGSWRHAPGLATRPETICKNDT